MTRPNWRWQVREQRDFIAALTETGDPRAAAKSAGRCLATAFRNRDDNPEFAALWAHAIGLAWELLECDVLAQQLRAARATSEADAQVAPVAPLDCKLALSALARRPVASARARAQRAAESSGVMKVRADISRFSQPQPPPLPPPQPPPQPPYRQ